MKPNPSNAEKGTALPIFKRKIKRAFVVISILLSNCLGQAQIYYLSVPFSSGWIGDNNGNNASNNVLSASSLGWTNLRFTQESTSTIFVAQGNDIIGAVKFEDASGVTRSIDGFVKWRAPSGTVVCLVFQPGTAVNVNANTNGSNGSSTYTITSTKYIGLVFNNETLDVSSGTVTGNAATSGLLDKLNGYLGTLPALSTVDYTADEATGTITVVVTLSASSSNTITVLYRTDDSTAVAGADYTAVNGTLTFAPGETTKNITIPITNDGATGESSELFSLILENSTNASLTKSISYITITEPLPLVSRSFSIQDHPSGKLLKWSAFNDRNIEYYEIQQTSDLDTWSTLREVSSKKSILLIDYELVIEKLEPAYYRVASFGLNGFAEATDVLYFEPSQDPSRALLRSNLVDQRLEFIEPFAFKIFDLYGSLLVEEKPMPSFDASGLSRGWYIIAGQNKRELFYKH